MRFFVFVFILFSVATASADTKTADVLLNEGEVQRLVDYFQKWVFQLRRDQYVYNWSLQVENDPYWQTPAVSTTDPRGYKRIKQQALNFWDYFNKVGFGLYGYGLYTATDPKETAHFGGFPSPQKPMWRLSEIKLPAGFKLLNFMTPITEVDEARTLLAKGGCNGDAAIAVSLLFDSRDRTSQDREHCLALTKEIFQKRLQIDGFAYMYGATAYPECAGGIKPQREIAIMLTSNTWLKPDHVRLFTPTSADDFENRQRLQNLFFKMHVDKGSTFASHMAMWPDMVGQWPDAGVESWMRQNLFGCSKEPSF